MRHKRQSSFPAEARRAEVRWELGTAKGFCTLKFLRDLTIVLKRVSWLLWENRLQRKAMGVLQVRARCSLHQLFRGKGSQTCWDFFFPLSYKSDYNNCISAFRRSCVPLSSSFHVSKGKRKAALYGTHSSVWKLEGLLCLPLTEGRIKSGQRGRQISYQI